MPPSFRTLADIALHVNEILSNPAIMAEARRLAESCLGDPTQSRIDALELPNDPGDSHDFDDDSLARERRMKEYAVLTPGQTALVVAVLHDFYCNGVEKMIVDVLIPSEPSAFAHDFADAATCQKLQAEGSIAITAEDFGRRVRWDRLLEWMRKAGEYASFWFTLRVRRFESIITVNGKAGANREAVAPALEAYPERSTNGNKTNSMPATETLATGGQPDGDDVLFGLLSVFTNGLSDERIEKARGILVDNNLYANEKLTKIDSLMPFPPTASAEDLGKLLGVSKQAVMKTAWWAENRKGQKDDEIGRRRANHAERRKLHEKQPQDNGDK